VICDRCGRKCDRSNTIEQRTGEIAVRMGFSAETQDMLRLVLDQGCVRLLSVSLRDSPLRSLGRLIESQLYQTSAHNPVLLAATTAILGLAALAACVIPARRATSIHPMDALRTE
jgi:putative ABC transport system permease protein